MLLTLLFIYLHRRKRVIKKYFFHYLTNIEANPIDTKDRFDLCVDIYFDNFQTGLTLNFLFYFFFFSFSKHFLFTINQQDKK